MSCGNQKQMSFTCYMAGRPVWYLLRSSSGYRVWRIRDGSKLVFGELPTHESLDVENVNKEGKCLKALVKALQHVEYIVLTKRQLLFLDRVYAASKEQDFFDYFGGLKKATCTGTICIHCIMRERSLHISEVTAAGGEVLTYSTVMARKSLRSLGACTGTVENTQWGLVTAILDDCRCEIKDVEDKRSFATDLAIKLAYYAGHAKTPMFATTGCLTGRSHSITKWMSPGDLNIDFKVSKTMTVKYCLNAIEYDFLQRASRLAYVIHGSGSIPLAAFDLPLLVSHWTEMSIRLVAVIQNMLMSWKAPPKKSRLMTKSPSLVYIKAIVAATTQISQQRVEEIAKSKLVRYRCPSRVRKALPPRMLAMFVAEPFTIPGLDCTN